MTRVSFACIAASVAALCLCSVAHSNDAEKSSTASELVAYEIKPSSTDASIHHFDEPNLVVSDRSAGTHAQLVVFLPGTDGRPLNDIEILKVIAGQGYRVIGPEYNDSPAVIQVCPHELPRCSGDFRRKRIFGDGLSEVVDNTAAESNREPTRQAAKVFGPDPSG